jgi:ABC-type glycerol-3-phosphate transport system permease component
MRTLPVGIASFQVSAATITWDSMVAGSVVSIVPIVIAFYTLQMYFVKCIYYENR